MNKLKLLVMLLEKQKSGDSGAKRKLLSWDVEVKDGYCLYNLYLEYKRAFSFEPGRVEALDPILNLSKKVQSQGIDDTSVIFKTAEWKTLVSLRGPVDWVKYTQCKNCMKIIPHMCEEGFLDERDLFCPKCGNILFVNCYENDLRKIPKCACGSEYVDARDTCPYCKNRVLVEYRWGSPYEYFKNHSFNRLKIM